MQVSRGQFSTCQYYFSSKWQQGHSQDEARKKGNRQTRLITLLSRKLRTRAVTKNTIKIASAYLDWHSTVTFLVLSSRVPLPNPSSQRSLSQGRLSCCSACVILPLSFLSQSLRPLEGTVRIHKRTNIEILQLENHAVMNITMCGRRRNIKNYALVCTHIYHWLTSDVNYQMYVLTVTRYLHLFRYLLQLHRTSVTL